MGTERRRLPELRHLGTHLQRARLDRGLSQDALAAQCDLSQAQVSLFESGRRIPSLDQFVCLARVLDVPLQRLIEGTDRPGTEMKDLAIELRHLGASDLWVAEVSVPGALRRAEDVIAQAVSHRCPDPRVLETIPALLSWNELNPTLLKAYGIATRTTRRLAWLADVALAIERQKGFPGGCRRDPLERFLKAIRPLSKMASWDDLGRPSDVIPTSPIWRRWKIRDGASLEDFERRAEALISLREADRTLVSTRRMPIPTAAKSPPDSKANSRPAKSFVLRRRKAGKGDADVC